MKIGDYVRTRKGISKITFIDDEIVREIIYTDTKEVFEYYTNNKGEEIKDYWEKYSSNLIDLIEVGDYVNGREVRQVYDLGFGKCFCFKNEYGRHYDKTYKIKSIVTKEQFESMEYKVVE